MTLFLCLILMLVLIIIKVPVAFAIFFSGAVGILLGNSLEMLLFVVGYSVPSAVNSYTLAAIPLFIFMAQLVLSSGVLDELFDAARVLSGKIRGGTGIAAIGAGSLFAAVSGSSTAAAATLASTSSSYMMEQGYSPRLSTGMVAVVGTLAAMVPPSILLVFYAITAEISVGKMLVAGFVPGALVSLALVSVLFLYAFLSPAQIPGGESYTWKQKAHKLKALWPIAILFSIVVGTIYLGLATPTEAAALGCFGGFMLSVANRKMNVNVLIKCLKETLSSSVMILFIIVGAHIFGHLLVESRATVTLINWIEGLGVEPIMVILILAVFYIALGFFMDQIAIIALTVPVTVPLIMSLGYDPVWFGVLIILLAEVGLVTPPLGLNVFVVSRVTGVPVEEVFKGVLPFIAAMLSVAALVILLPDLILFLPNTM
ncbi:TRAP transporter large permease [Vreelandella titanicae]|uniref:TRAP transporter large permease n=1 Tax=Vreelandella titanicae TaxID=664683 RepID=UPI00315A8EF1